MKTKTIAGMLATATLLSVSASGAFADLVFGGGFDVPNSFGLHFTAIVNSGFTATPPFNEIRLTWIAGNNSYDKGGFHYDITNNQKFEEVAGGDPHKVIQDFNKNSTGLGSAASLAWSETSPNALGTFITAKANGPAMALAVGDTLDFNVFFGPGFSSDGTHFYLEFFNGSSFATAYEVSYKVGSSDGNTARTGFEAVQLFAPIPLPPAVWSGLAMMAGFGVFLAKRRRDRKTLA